MGIIHDGAQDGVGTSAWDSQQKARHFGSNRNKVALAVLDTAQEMGLISKDERGSKLATAQRYLNSSVVREALGIDTPYTADFSAAFVATERLRLANEGSIRTNITQFMDKLRQADVKSPTAAPSAATGGN